MKALLVLSAVDRMNTQAYPPFPIQGEPLRSNLWKFDGRNGGWTRGNPDRCRSLTQEKNSWVLDGMYRLYAKLPNPIGCPLGHAAGDSDGVSAVMKEKALKTLQQSPAFLMRHFGIWGCPWDGAREGKSLRRYMAGCHCGRTGRRKAGAYRQSVPLSQRDRPSLLLNPGVLVLARLVVEL